MRIMLFTDTYPPQVNGVATSVYNLARMLVEQGHDVMVCTAHTRLASEETFPVARTHAIPLPGSIDLDLATPIGLTLPRAVRRFRPHLIHAHTPFSVGWQAMLASRIECIPLIGTHHSHQVVFSGHVGSSSRYGLTIRRGIIARAVRSITSLYYNRCDLAACASDFLAKHMASYGIQQKIHIIPNAVDTTLFCPLPEASRCGVKLVYVGRLAVDKNLRQLIAMIKPILESDSPSVSLDIIGDGPERDHLVKFVCSQGLEHKIRFTGLLHGDELIRAIASSDICVSASLSDNQPMSLLESLACGVPVVALHAGGVPEIIENGYNGFLVDLSDDTSTQFVRYLKQLVSDKYLRQLMRMNTRTYIQRHNGKCLDLTLNAYQEAIYRARVRIGKRVG